MILRKMTTEGVAKFSEYLDLLDYEKDRPIPTDLLVDSTYSDILGTETEVENKTLSTRYEAAKYLDEILVKTRVPHVDRDAGVGAWLTLFFFDQLFPPYKERKLVERAAYIPEPQNYQRYYRHLLFGPLLIFRTYRAEPKRAMAFLCRPLHIRGDIVEQLASRQEIISNPAVVELATHLYYDPSTGTTKKWAGGKGGGSPRRLADILRQFDKTWDLYSMSLNEFLDILPTEFEKFRPTT